MIFRAPVPLGALIGAAVSVLLAVTLLAAAPPRGEAAPPAALPGGIGALSQTAPADHVGSLRCAGCHQAEAAAWAGSHHAAAMAKAEPATIRGDFSGATVEHRGATGRFYRDGDRFMVETQGRDGKLARFEVSHAFGLEPLQQYLVTFPDGRLQALPWAWDTRPKAQGGQRWFHVYGDQDIPPSDPLHWTRGQQTWNHMCAECHSTALTKGYDPASDTYKTRFSEISVGCESCHGPGAAHLAWAAASPRPADPRKGFAAVAPRRPAPDWAANPATGSPAHGVSRAPGDEVETCARCHSRRGLLREAWAPGQPLEATHLPSFLSEGLFEADGQMRDEVFNDHSFKQSLMYAKGVVCSDCHDPHSGRLKAAGAQVCGQCHQPERFAARAHTGHAEGPGAPDCVSCHMPQRTYMVVDTRHDHSFRIPRPDLSARIATPNACNACHADRTPQWAAEAVERWHGPARKGLQGWGETFALARRGDPAARDHLAALVRDPAIPGLARATAMSELTRWPAAEVTALAKSVLAEPAPLLRIAAMRALAGLPAEERARALAPLLGDPTAAVRMEVARLLADVPPASLPSAERARLDDAFALYEASQRLNADRPENRAALAGYWMQRGRIDQAEAELLAGLRLEPTVAVLAVNLADLYRASGREAAAEQTLRRAVSLSPGEAGPRHALGLSLIRQKRYPEALAQLARAHELDPGDGRFAYVYGVALQSLGRPQEARAVLEKAAAAAPFNADLLSALLADALKSGDVARAAPLAERLAALRPEDREVARLAARLKQQ